MNELFLKIINTSISAGWLILAVLLLRFVLKKSPKWIHALLWGLVALRCICPFSIESALSLIPSAETIPLNIEQAAAPSIHSGIDVINNAVNPILSQSSTPMVGASANPLQITLAILEFLWILGMLAMAFYTALSYWRLHRRVSTAVRLRDTIFQSENVRSPFVLGLIRPKIYLPFKMSAQDQAHVIAHEQAHIRRRDHWWKPLGFLLLTIHWFNPLMWLAYTLLCRDIELACDERVIKHLDNERRADYTQALVACSVSRRTMTACPLAFGEVGVKARVKSVMNYKKPAFWSVILAVVLCIVVAACFLTNPKPDSYTLKISVPAGNQEEFAYSDEEIRATKGSIKIWPGDRLENAAVLLSPVDESAEAVYTAAYFAQGTPVELEAETDAWFRVGVRMQNSTDEDLLVSVRVENAEVRISDKATLKTEITAAGRSELPVETGSSKETSGLSGNWVLDAVYTENCNPGLSLQEWLEADTGASLRLSDDGTMECRIGAFTGKGAWYPDGDTGRYAADLVASPENKSQALTFYEFRESPEGEEYLILEYEGYSFYWTQSDT